MPRNESVTDKVSKSAVALIIRQVLSVIINVVGGIFLARLLTPVEFGIYAIALFAFNFIRVFGDVGFGAGLIRSKTEPKRIEYTSLFTLQQIVVAFIVLGFWFLAPWITRQYSLDPSYIWLLRLVALSLVGISFMVIPQIQLERNLEFDKLAIVEVLQAAAFNIVAVVLAFKGFGAFSLGWGFLARAVLGTLLVNIIHPWPISFRFHWRAIRKHLKFGVSFQATNFISTINAAVNPVLIALVFGMAAAGYVEWAVLLIGYLQRPLTLLNRLLFPAYSKVRDQLQKLSKAVNHTYVVSAFVFFAFAGLLFGLAPGITKIVFGGKWLPALSLLYLLILSRIFIPMSIPNGALGYSLGWANTILYLNIAKSIVLWITVVVFITITDSILAYGYAMIVTECLHVVLYYLLKRELPQLTVMKTQILFLIAAFLLALTLISLSNFWVISGWLTLCIALAGGGMVYLIYCLILYVIYNRLVKDEQISNAMHFLYKNLKNKLV